jgi:hypothetical protein
LFAFCANALNTVNLLARYQLITLPNKRTCPNVQSNKNIHTK